MLAQDDRSDRSVSGLREAGKRSELDGMLAVNDVD
jgi:hypothetical protein